jgi:hypothetical protein
MRIIATKPLPDNGQLKEVLKNEFSRNYSCELFGLNGQKTILIGKSAFVGAQVSVKEREITIQATPPSVFTGNFLFFFSLIGADTILGLLFRSQLRKIEMDVAGFLKTKFG